MTSHRSLPPDEAADRVRLITAMLSVDARRAIMSSQYLRVSNYPVLREIREIETPAADGHNMSQNALQILLVLELARLFDISDRPVEKQDKASLPILAHFLSRDDVRSELHRGLDRQQQREHAGASFLARWSRLSSSAVDQEALRKLKLFRNFRVGHSLLKDEPPAPTFAELFRLCAIVAGLSVRAEIASGVEVHDHLFTSRHYRNLAGQFWARFVAGVRVLDA